MSKNNILDTDISKLSIKGSSLVLHFILLSLVRDALRDNVIRIQDVDDLNTVFQLEQMVVKL